MLYTSTRYRNVPREKRSIQSRSPKADGRGRAYAESFLETLTNELIGTTIYENRRVAMKAAFEQIETGLQPDMTIDDIRLP